MTTMTIGRESVLGALKERAPKSMHLMEVVAALSLPKQRRDDVRDVLDELTALGMATQMPGNRFRLAKSKSNGDDDHRRAKRREPSGEEAFGWLTLHPRGFAFVSTDDETADIFIPGSALNGAMPRDTVHVTLVRSFTTLLDGWRPGATGGSSPASPSSSSSSSGDPA